MEQGGARRRKKLKYELLEEDWGAAKTTINEPQLEDNERAQELLCTTELPTQLEGAMSHSMDVVTTPSMGAVVTIPHIGATEELETVNLAPTTPDICVIKKRTKHCVTHGCDVKSFDVTSKKWQFVKSKNEF